MCLFGHITLKLCNKVIRNKQTMSRHQFKNTTVSQNSCCQREHPVKSVEQDPPTCRHPSTVFVTTSATAWFTVGPCLATSAKPCTPGVSMCISSKLACRDREEWAGVQTPGDWCRHRNSWSCSSQCTVCTSQCSAQYAPAGQGSALAQRQAGALWMSSL